MLDKSVTYKRIIMKLDHNKNNFSASIALPEGYTFKMYEPGDENHWAQTETEVLEYETKDEALVYFKKELGSHKEQLKERMVFITNQEGIPIANACAWYINYKGKHQAHVHYLAVRPAYQKLGLGKALLMKVLTIFSVCEAGEDIYLHTQTFSHVAIKMYLSMGFKVVKDDSIGYYDKHMQEAIEVLEMIYDEATMRQVRGSKYKYNIRIKCRSMIARLKLNKLKT